MNLLHNYHSTCGSAKNADLLIEHLLLCYVVIETMPTVLLELKKINFDP